jgi:hypothetical protein
MLSDRPLSPGRRQQMPRHDVDLHARLACVVKGVDDHRIDE